MNRLAIADNWTYRLTVNSIQSLSVDLKKIVFYTNVLGIVCRN